MISKKDILKKLILDHPELMKDLLNQYKSKSAKSYDFNTDPKGEFRWHGRARIYADQFPLNLKDLQAEKPEVISDSVCNHFSELIHKGLGIDFYKDSGDPNTEKTGQLILLELLEQYTKETCLTVKYDSNKGTISLCNYKLGDEIRIIVKYTSTRGIIEYYEKLQKSHLSNTVLLLVILNGSGSIIDRISAIDREYKSRGIELTKRFNIYAKIKIYGGRKQLLM